MSLILNLLPLLEGWQYGEITKTLTINPGDTIYISLPKPGYIKNALITTTSPLTTISLTEGLKASPQFLMNAGLLYDTKPAALLKTTPPYTILFAPYDIIPNLQNSRISIYEPSQSTTPAQVSIIIATIEIIDREKFTESLKEILGNPENLSISINTLTSQLQQLNKTINELKQHSNNININQIMSLLRLVR